MQKEKAEKYFKIIDESTRYIPSSLEQEIITTRYFALFRCKVDYLKINKLSAILLKDAVRTYCLIEPRKKLYTEEEFNEALKSMGIQKVKYLLEQVK